MAFYSVSTDKSMVEDFNGSGGFLVASGMYPVTIKHALVEVGEQGSQYINLIVGDDSNNTRTIYQAFRLTTNEGKQNDFGVKQFNKLCVVLGFTDEINDPVEVEIPLGKDNIMTTCYELEDLKDQEVVLHIKNEYSLYNKKIRESKLIRNSFRFNDFASSEEIVEETEVGKQYKFESETANNNLIRDGLTEDDVKAFIEDRRSNRSSTPKTENNKPSGGLTKRFGKK